MKKPLPILFFLCLSTGLSAQGLPAAQAAQTVRTEADLNTLMIGTPQAGRLLQTYDGRYEGVRGSEFLWEGWLPGQLYTRDGQQVPKGLSFRFDASKNELHARSARDTAAVKILLNETINSLVISGVGFRRVDVPGEPKDRIYAQLYVSDNYELLVFVSKTLRKADFQSPVGGPDRRYDEWVVDRKYFLRQGKSIKKAKLSRSSLAKLLPKGADPLLAEDTYDDVTEQEAVALLKQLDRS
jgi:hypothetical protein